MSYHILNSRLSPRKEREGIASPNGRISPVHSSTQSTLPPTPSTEEEEEEEEVIFFWWAIDKELLAGFCRCSQISRQSRFPNKVFPQSIDIMINFILTR